MKKDIKASGETNDFMAILKKKTEEADYLKNNIKELQGKASELVSIKNCYMSELNSPQGDFEIQKKDRIIQLYQKILNILGNEKVEPLQRFASEGDLGSQIYSKKTYIRKENKPDTSLKKLLKIDTHNSNSSFTTGIYKSTDPTLSKLSLFAPSGEKSESQQQSKTIELNSSKDEASPILPSNTAYLKRQSSQDFHKNISRPDPKAKAIVGIYRTVINTNKYKGAWIGKKELSRSMNPLIKNDEYGRKYEDNNFEWRGLTSFTF